MSDTIPMWAKERAVALANADRGMSSFTTGDIGYSKPLTAFARYIATKESPPVDPLLIEARKVAAERTKFPAYADTYLSGENDEHFYVQGLLAALRRGMELAK